MKLLLLLAIVCLGISVSGAQDESNSTCIHPSCNCDGVSLICHDLTALPDLPTPNQFTAFLFYDCNIETLSQMPASYSNATDLLIANSGLSSIADDAFELLSGLETLELRGNRLKAVSRNSLLPLTELVKLDLSYNRLEDLPNEIFTDHPKLEEIDLGGNQIQFRDDLFNGADALTKLFCNDCQLKDVPTSALKKIGKLGHLELNQNPIQSLWDNTFQGLEQIQNLTLDNCSLSDISKDTLHPFHSLRQLNLGHNELKYIPVGTFSYSWHSLRKIYLENNLFTYVDENLAPWSTLDELTLRNNPWHCDCHLAWIKNISVNKFPKENVTCVSPPELKDHPIQKLNVSQMTCPEGTSSKHLVTVAFGIVVLVLGVIVIIWFLIKAISRHRRYKGTEVKYSQVYGETVSTFDSRNSLVST